MQIKAALTQFKLKTTQISIARLKLEIKGDVFELSNTCFNSLIEQS